MSHPFRIFTLLACAALPGLSAMRIDQILNNYNPSTGPGLPNYSIAQGSIAIVKGAELSDRSTGLQTTYPLPTTLEGVTVDITVQGTKVSCILYYVLPQQIAFIVPSTTPLGTGTLQINNNGSIGTAEITIGKTGFGIMTANGAGTGPAVAIFGGTANSVRNNNAANPDDLITLWGSGIGPFAGDESILNNEAQDYTSIDTQVLVGSVPAQVLYRGASQFPGLNQISFKVPGGILPAEAERAATPTAFGFGCYVSLLVITNGVPSNVTTLPIQAKGSRACSDPPAQSFLTNAQLDAFAAKGEATFASLFVGRNTFAFPGSATSVGDSATGRYQKFDLANFNLNSAANAASFGSCAVTIIPKVPAGVTLPAVTVTPLDAGPALTLAGIGNSLSLPKSSGTNLFYFSSGGVPTGLLGNGIAPVTITAPGGPDIGSHSASTPVPIGFVWLNETAIASTPIDRSKGVTVTWANAPANGFVQINGSSANSGGSATFICYADPSAGTFTVQPDVLRLLPASQGPNTPAFSVAAYVNQSFPAEHLDYGLISGFVSFSRGVTFQ